MRSLSMIRRSKWTFFLYALNLLYSSSLSKLQITEQQGPIISMEAVEGRSVQLPCDVTSPNPIDKVYMVFWFKADTGIPLYSFDVRGKPLSKASHHSTPEVFGTRAFFRTVSEPATLVIEDIRRHDQGLYRCRVDFRNSATKSFRYNLTIIVPPEKPTLLDRFGRQLNGTIGPLDEGEDVLLTCHAIGGNPEPKVRWLLNGITVDEEYEHNAGDVIENRIIWSSISRKDLNSIFTCQATNTHLIEPQENSVVLDLRLKPLMVQMLTIDAPLLADRRYDIVCISKGSRPAAIITWYKATKQLRRVKEEFNDNSTRSELNFIPSTEDNGKTLTCRAENPNITNGQPLESHWKLNVIFAPIVSLKLGSTLKADDIKEGDDVYFECHVRANPPCKKLIWLHNGVIMSHNTSARVIRSNHSLVLQRLTRQSAGRYSCLAANAQGESYSNELTFRVQYTPSCRSDKIMVIGATRSESLEIVCEVDADPPAKSFRWKFNNSGETIEVGSERFVSNGSVSILRYTPVADLDYGTLSCWAINDIGLQSLPCVFQLVSASKPQILQNCSLEYNQTNSSVDIKCRAGYDGGLPQIFLLEVYTNFASSPVYNLTSVEYPAFKLTGLQNDVTFKIILYAANSKGRSPPVTLDEFSFKDPEKRTAMDGLDIGNFSSSIFGIMACVVLSLVVLCLLLFFFNVRGTKYKFGHHRNQPLNNNLSSNHEKSSNEERLITNSSPAPVVIIASNNVDDKNPDLIPNSYNSAPVTRKNISAVSTSLATSTLSSSQNSTWDSSTSNTNLLPVGCSPKYHEKFNPLAGDDDEFLYPEEIINNYHHHHQENAATENNFENKISSTMVIANPKSTVVLVRKEVELNGRAIKETLMSNKLPESCV